MDVNELLPALAKLAPRLQAKSRSRPFAQPHYDAMSDALIWKDEIVASLPQDQMGALRYLFRFRMTLIQGMPNEELRPLWRRARELCPKWIGFSDKRSSPSARLVEVYNRKSAGFAKVLAGFTDESSG